MILQLIYCVSLMSMASLEATYASGLQCPGSKSTQYKPFNFQPICPVVKPFSTQDTRTCLMGAATTSTSSAAVLKKQPPGTLCQVTPFLCPRYKIIGEDTTVLVPAGIPVLEHVVFSIKSGCGIKVWDLYTGASAANSDYLVQPAHPDAATLPSAFRSSLLDNMQLLISRLVYKHFIVQLYRATAVVQRLVFDVGASSASVTSMNWFDKGRLVQSTPVTNLSSMPTNYFTIAGDANAGLSLWRRFFISFNYGGCTIDRALMVVLDAGNDPCNYYAYSTPIPRIAYSADVNQEIAASIRDADYMAILVV